MEKMNGIFLLPGPCRWFY